MKSVYIDSHLDSLLLAWRRGAAEWIFSGGRRWLLLTPRRLLRIAGRLGLEDGRVDRLVVQVRRYAACPEEYCRLLGIGDEGYYDPCDYPPVLCPECDGVHWPHPVDAELPCLSCREVGGEVGVTELARGELLEDGRARERLRVMSPGDFCDGELSPGWRINYARRLSRDWDAATNRILMGATYRAVAREFDCSVGLLHKKVHERNYWENN